MKTYSAKPSEVTHGWYLVDAEGLTLGRLATVVAMRLMGKHKATYTAHIDCGDNVVVVNAAKISVTGNKLEDKKYYRHSGYPGGIKERSLAEQLERDPAEVIRAAVRGMLPKNRLQDDRMNRLKVYATAEHPHEGQSPQKLDIKEAKRG
jgi:large subunit ribosomal protein L13